MGASVLDMAMSLDGYIAGPNDVVGNALGDGGDRLFTWGVTPEGELIRTGVAGQMFEDILTTGAVLTGRRTAEHAGHWDGDHHDGVRMYISSHQPPGPDVTNFPLITYVSDGIESAMAQAKAAAGDRNVLVHGAITAREALEAGVLDEIVIHLIPVMLGCGRRLFDVLPSTIDLEVVQVFNTPEATHLHYRVRR